ncbi:MAG: hypothetical protein EAY75_03660 [Bacteroidetes bacterium]|nr:MAG: hypothetical protein EAY75_03660 [Bacteroidota bacterium]
MIWQRAFFFFNGPLATDFSVYFKGGDDPAGAALCAEAVANGILLGINYWTGVLRLVMPNGVEQVSKYVWRLAAWCFWRLHVCAMGYAGSQAR